MHIFFIHYIYIMDKKEKSKGLGDTIAKITDAVGIKKCKGCEKRQKILNKKFAYKRDLTDEEKEKWISFVNRDDQSKIKKEDSRFILKILKECLGMSVKPCYNCGKASWDVWINKIQEKYDRQ